MAVLAELRRTGSEDKTYKATLKSERPLIVFLGDERARRVDLTGGKGSSLAKMKTIPGIEVPDGFVVTPILGESILQNNPYIANETKSMDVDSLSWIKVTLRNEIEAAEDLEKVITKKGRKVREAMKHAKFSSSDEYAIKDAYSLLSETESSRNVRVAVRSSGACEDGDEFSFAGENETYLHQEKSENVIDKARDCLASQFGDRVIKYRMDAMLKLTQRELERDPNQNIDDIFKKIKAFSHAETRLASVIQTMADGEASGVAFSVDSATGSKLCKININHGLGEAIVSGSVTPDSYEADLDKRTIVSRTLGEKKVKTVRTHDGTKLTKTSKEERLRYVLSDEIIKKVMDGITAIKEFYGCEVDTEFVIKNGKVYFVQARPETVASGKDQMIIKMKENAVSEDVVRKAEVIFKGGRMGSPGTSTGTTMYVKNMAEANKFIKKKNDKEKKKNGKKEKLVLVTGMTTPDWVPVMKKVDGIVTRAGGENCHAAIVCRELQLPCIVGAEKAVDLLKKTKNITMDARNATIFKGELPLIEVGEDIDLREYKKNLTKTTLGLILANPDEAKRLHALAELGDNFKISLLRAEFLLGEIGVHVNALVDYDKETLDKKTRKEVAKKLAESGYSSGREYFITKYCEGISKFAAIFPHSEIVLRTTDYKTNEYKDLIGGRIYEAIEENPMMGERGLPRFLWPRSIEGFKWELEAINKARDDGYKNIEIMFPMVRSPRELAGTVKEMEEQYMKGARSVKDVMAEVGLEKGKDGLKVLMMVENPANVLRLDEFIDTGMIDEISIGSNDLTQFILAVDRDNGFLGKIAEYSEMNPAVLKSIDMALEVCRRRGIKAGICGNGPSKFPELAKFLVARGISSVGVTQDMLLKTQRVVKEEEGEIAVEGAKVRETVIFEASS